MKILLIDEEFPYPLNSGKRLRTYNLVKHLATTNEITYLAYGETGSGSFDAIKALGITPVAVSPPDRKQSGLQFYWRLLLNLLSPLPYIVTSHFSRPFQDTLQTLMQEQKYDVVISEGTPYAVFLKDVNQCKKIIVAQNIESSIWKRYEKNETNPFRKLYISIQRRKVEQFERDCFHQVDGATTVSRMEAQELSSYGLNFSPAVVENGVDCEYFVPDKQQPDPDQLVFTGAMDWRPNQDAVLYFVSEILPLIKEIKPNLIVNIVGRNPSRAVTELGHRSDVNVTGTVPDVRPFIGAAAVYIVPLRIGGGSRLKILEAMAMQKAIVSTSVGAEGLSVTSGTDIVIADKPAVFARAVIDLIDDSNLRNKLARRGLELVHQHYRWEKMAAVFEQYLKNVVGKK